MADQTPRFGFSYFGAGVPGSISDDGQKFTALDPVVLDRILADVERHDHKYRPIMPAMEEAPTGVLVSGDGALEGGDTYYYVVSLVDKNGMESLPSPELQVETPAPLDPPELPVLTGDPDVVEETGSLEPDFYYYALTGLRGGEESPLGQSAIVTLTAGETAVLVELPEYGEVESYRIWRMGSSDPGYTAIGTTDQETFVDDGSVEPDPCSCDPGVAPPTVNTGISDYSIEITLPDSVDVSELSAWRVYRSTDAGFYPTASLVHEVVETVDEWDEDSPLVDTWTDDGWQPMLGSPQVIDRNIRVAPLSLDMLEALPISTPYPEGYPLLVGAKLYVKRQGVWQAVSGGSSGGGMSSVMTSPDGNRWILSVDDSGALVTTPTDFPGPPTPPQEVTVGSDESSST